MNARGWGQRLIALWRGQRLDRELDDEVRAHLEMAERDAMATGLSADEARRVARLRFGGVSGMKEEHRDRRSVRWIELLATDARRGLAALRREPAFAAIAIGVLALGIGAHAAMFSLLDAVLLKPLPFPQSDRIVRIWDAPRPGVVNSTTTPDFLAWQRLGTAFEAVAAEFGRSVTLSGRSEPVRLAAKAVTADYFTVFGTPARVGRVFNRTDEESDSHAVAVLGYAAWQTYFGGEPRMLGQRLLLDGAPYEIIGILPPGAFDRDRVDVWMPLVFTPEQRQAGSNHWLTIHGRLRGGSTLTQAQDQLQAVQSALRANAPAKEREGAVVVQALERLLVGDSLRRSIMIGFGAAALLLLIACANVANLSLVRGTARRKELAVRAALGAGRARLVSQLLTESLVLATLGGVAGLAVAYLLIQVATPVLADSIPYTADVRLDLRAFAFTAGIVLGVALIIGTLPAVQTRFDNLARSLSQATRGSSGAHGLAQRAIAIGEVALALVLVCAAGLLVRSVQNLQQLSVGARVDNIVTMRVDLPRHAYPTAESASAFYSAAAERLRAIPGVAQAALSTQVPLRWIGNGEAISLPGLERDINVRFKRVDPGYFEALDIPLRAGRGITDRDRPGTTPVIVINEALAARLGETAGIVDPIGMVVRLSSAPAYGPVESQMLSPEIVGIIRSERVGDPWASDPPVVYVPLAQAPTPSVTLIVRTAQDAASVMPDVRAALREVAPTVPYGKTATMQQIRDETFAGTTRPAWMIGLFAAVAALLAALGLYGVLAHLVSQRRREIGIRMALGAGAGDVVSHVMRDALSMVAMGLAIGLLAAFGTTRVLANMLYEVSPLDPIALVLACVAMTGVGLLAAFMPASRAARVNPVGVLREDG